MIRQTIGGRLAHDIRNRGLTAWLLFGLLSGFYVVLYFGVDYGHPQTGVERAQAWLYGTFTVHLDAFGAQWLSFGSAESGLSYAGNRWTLYALLYTLAMLVGGAWMFHRYRHNPYQMVRTFSVLFLQVSFAFSVPILLKFFGHPEYYFSYLWPLKIEYLDPAHFEYFGEILVLYAFFASLVLTPLLGLLWGKRWYCSWVCGCGGLANTAGEPWRHLSQKGSTAWRFEKFAVHGVLLIAVASTALWFASALLPEGSAVGGWAEGTRRWYGLVVVAGLSGAVGTGLYPIGGTRIWCRYFCPMAAILGLVQKAGRFRIRVKRNMCISCGLCSKYCEMGIDVRAYAQANRDFVRASCVGCGLCAEVCPRGVLRLENVRRRDPQELTLDSLADGSWR
ncbi:MAG: 4Fe-4S binding protein [Deltaproteobacteria bacterium]|nr:MAG: 4Fe-4S binding protein [Deltaproteobacteria bacterium]